jgi:hypothetical protein
MLHACVIITMSYAYVLRLESDAVCSLPNQS